CIRYFHVTGVQMCALPIWPGDAATADVSTAGDFTADDVTGADIEADDAFGDTDSDEGGAERDEDARAAADAGVQADAGDSDAERSEEHTSELQSRENLVCR